MLNPFGGLKKVFKPLNKAVSKVGGAVGKATHLPAPPGFGKKNPSGPTVSKLAPKSAASSSVVSKMKARKEA